MGSKKLSEGMEPTGEDGLHSLLLRFMIAGMDGRIGRVASIAGEHGRQGRTMHLSSSRQETGQ